RRQAVRRYPSVVPLDPSSDAVAMAAAERRGAVAARIARMRPGHPAPPCSEPILLAARVARPAFAAVCALRHRNRRDARRHGLRYGMRPSPPSRIFPMTRIAFIGGGNMARSLIGGLLATGHAAADIRVADPLAETRERLGRDFGVATFAENRLAVADADVILLAVKPQAMPKVHGELRHALQGRRPLMISIAAGVRLDQLERWLGALPIVRCMPNTPALIGAGATGLCANGRVSPSQKAQAQHILAAAGLTRWIADETLMDTVTALSGSGPAYFFALVEALEDAAVAQACRATPPARWLRRPASAPAACSLKAAKTPPNCAAASPRRTAPPRPRWKASPPTGCRAGLPAPLPPPPAAARNSPPPWIRNHIRELPPQRLRAAGRTRLRRRRHAVLVARRRRSLPRRLPQPAQPVHLPIHQPGAGADPPRAAELAPPQPRRPAGGVAGDAAEALRAVRADGAAVARRTARLRPAVLPGAGVRLVADEHVRPRPAPAAAAPAERDRRSAAAAAARAVGGGDDRLLAHRGDHWFAAGADSGGGAVAGSRDAVGGGGLTPTLSLLCRSIFPSPPTASSLGERDGVRG